MGSKKKNNQKQQKNSLTLHHIGPETLGQKKIFDSYEDCDHIIASGLAGTGKTFISLYLAMADIHDPNKPQEQLVIVRSAVPTRDQGFLPGNASEKMEIFESPYAQMFSQLYDRGDAFQVLKQKELVHVASTSYVRGMTFDNAIILIDEAQNATFHELDSVITRLGMNSRLLLCGDTGQNDLINRRFEYSGFSKAIEILMQLDQSFVDHINLGADDVLRSEFVKQYLIAKQKVNVNQPQEPNNE